MMPKLLRHLPLIAAAILSVAITICSSLLYLSYLAGITTATEIADSTTTLARRVEIARGLERAGSIQMTLANTIWWSALVVGLIVVAHLTGIPRRTQPR
jgi:hypothetical protein